MIEALRELLPFFAAAYLLDSIVHAGDGLWIFTSLRGRGFRACFSGFRLAGLLPFSRAFTVVHTPVLAAPAGLFVAESPGLTGAQRYEADSYRLIAWEDLEDIAIDGDRLELANGLRMQLASEHEATDLGNSLAGLANLKPAQRSRRIEAFVASRHDIARIRERHARVTSEPNLIEAWGMAAFAFLFICLPVSVYAPEPLYEITAALLSLLAASAVTAAVLSVRWARRMRADGIHPPRGALFSICCFPLAAIHAVKSLAPNLFAGCDAIAVAGVLLPREDFLPLARQELCGIEHALAGSNQAAWVDAWSSCRGSLLSVLDACAVEPAEVRRPPARRAGDARAYCAMCDGEFVEAVEVCPECGVRTLGWMAD